MKNYDVAIVGAGPVGSTFARYMAEKGLKVAIFEKKKEVGVPLQCAGLLGNKIKDVNVLPEEVILNKIYGACLYSPSSTMISMRKKEEPLAYVLDRVRYDKYLAQLAVDKGAELFLNHRAEKIDIENGEIYFKDKKISAEIIVGADGHSSIVSEAFGNDFKFVHASQYLIDTGESTFKEDYFQVYVNSKISPGFLWVIPISESTARVGLFADFDYKELSEILNEFLENNEELRDSKILKKYHGKIPIYDPKKDIVKNRAILIGDAASQVKPTTSGGLIIGFNCAKIAAEVVYESISSQNIDILKNYQKRYKKMYNNELKMQLKVQNTYKSLDDDNLDSVILKLKEKEVGKIVSEYGDLDSQAPLMIKLIKSGIIFSVLPKLLSRKIFGL
ncbi:NAD(P)/FAD-dependent oxidoreductase [Methanobacterium sp.]|jgi:digeranylgeranylglycerophospholipid reductase|uniref:NAD(P)/FAD-dependent oxidoreductase n=1 Tax=Methanobacterium sp. TaxID=2164 RepID=UPI003158F98B